MKSKGISGLVLELFSCQEFSNVPATDFTAAHPLSCGSRQYWPSTLLGLYLAVIVLVAGSLLFAKRFLNPKVKFLESQNLLLIFLPVVLNDQSHIHSRDEENRLIIYSYT